MNIDPGWQRRLWCYRYRKQWMTVEAVVHGRAKGIKALELANAYTFGMLVRRYMAGRDVPGWTIAYIERELGLERAG